MKLFTILFAVYALFDLTSGRTCTVKQLKYSSTQKYKTIYTSSRYTTRCSNLWDWFSCTKYREVARKQSFTEVRTYYTTAYECCDGWSGRECNTHNKPPELDFCPESYTVQASDESAVVSWQKPQFTEPEGFDLTIQTNYESPATLPYGSTTITYTATSTNNNMQATCRFNIYLEPPVDHVEVLGVDSGVLSVVEDVGVTLMCQALYGKPPFSLNWQMDGESLPQQTDKTEVTSLSDDGYYDATNQLYFVPHRRHQDKTLVCLGTKPGRQERVELKVNVTFDPAPTIELCPISTQVQTTDRVTTIVLETPLFSCVRNDPLDVTCSRPTGMFQELGLGVYEVICRAENQRTHKTTECSYSLSLQSKRCPDLTPGPQGAYLCGEYEVENKARVRLCQPGCLEGYDVSFRAVVPSLFVCSLEGQWFPDLPTIDCSGPRNTILAPNMGENHYFAPDLCTNSATQWIAQSTFSSVVAASDYHSVCADVYCMPRSFNVICA